MDDQRYQFFWELQGPIVVGAIGCERRQSVCLMVGVYKVIGRCFACTVRTIRLIPIFSVNAGASGLSDPYTSSVEMCRKRKSCCFW